MAVKLRGSDRDHVLLATATTLAHAPLAFTFGYAEELLECKCTLDRHGHLSVAPCPT